MEMYLDSTGKLLIPVAIRKQLGLTAGCKVIIEIKDKKIIISNPEEK